MRQTSKTRRTIGIRGQLMGFLCFICLLLVGLFWFLSTQLLEPLYPTHIQKQLTEQAEAIVARMDEARLPAAQPVDLSGTARESVQAFQEAAAARGLTLTGQIAPDVVLQTSREHMVQLLTVLLDNGVKYTESGGTVSLTLTKEGSAIRLQVRNSPTQVPEGDLSRLFDRFGRGDPARSQKTGGYGIGLSAAQAIVQAWQGTITAQAEGADTMVFTVTF